MNDAPASTPSTSTATHLVITVHGIRTFGHWQERLERLVQATPNGAAIHFVHYKYGYLSIIGFMMPFFVRWLIVRRFRKTLVSICERTPWSRIDLVGHSFGTYIVVHAIRDLPKDSRIKFNTILLAGSVLRGSFSWTELIGGRVARVINECGTRDFILVLAQLFILRMGAAGWTGFTGATSRDFRNRYSDFGHSGYFLDRSGNPDDSYMSTHWVPLLTEDGPVPNFDHRVGSLAQGVLQFIGNNAEPFKLAAYISPFVVLTIVVSGLYFNALLSETKLIARIASERTANGAPEAAVSMLLEVVRDERLGMFEKNRFRPASPEASAALYNALASYRNTQPLPGHTDRVIRTQLSSDGKNALTASDEGKVLYWTLHPEPASREIPVQSKDFLVTNGLSDALLSPNGKVVAIATWEQGISLWKPDDLSLLGRIDVDRRQLWNLSFSPDSNRLVAVSSRGNLVVANLETKEVVNVPVSEDLVFYCVTFSHDGRYVAAGTKGGTVHLVDALLGTEVSVLQGSGAQRSVSFSPDDRYVASSSEDRSVRIWNVQTKAETAAIKSAHNQRVQRVEFHPNGRQLMTASWDGYIQFWTLPSLNRLHIPEPHERHSYDINSALYSADGQLVLSVSADGTARLWDTNTGKMIDKIVGAPSTLTVADFSRDGRRIMLGGDAGWVSLLSVSPAGIKRIARDHNDYVRTLGFSPDGQRMITSSDDRTVRTWDTASGRELLRIPFPDRKGRFIGAAFSPDGKQILTSSFDSAQLHDADTGSLLKRFDGQSGTNVFARFSPDGRHIAIINSFNFIQLWMSPYAEPAREWKEPFGEIKSIEFSDDGEVLAFSDDGNSYLWNLKEVASRPVVMADVANVLAWKFVDNRKYAISGDRRGTVSLWTTDHARLLGKIEQLPSDPVSCLTVVAARNFVVVGFMDGALKVIDIATWKVVATLPRHSRYVTALLATKDGRFLFSSSKDGKIRVWDLHSFSLVAELSGHGAEVSALAMPPDEQILGSASFDNTVRLWRVFSSAQQLVDAARDHSSISQGRD